MLPPGKYIGKVITTTFLTSSQKGTPYFEVMFQIEHNGEVFTVAGAIWLTEKAMGMARGALKAIGFDPDTTELDVLVNAPASLMGREAQVTVIEEERQDGEGYITKVAFINPIPKAPEANVLKSLSKALRDVKGSTKPKAVKAIPSKTSTKAIENYFHPGQDSSGEPNKGDDIPF